MRYVNVDDTGALRDEVCRMHWSGPNKPWNKGHEDKIHSEFWAVYGEEGDGREGFPVR